MEKVVHAAVGEVVALEPASQIKQLIAVQNSVLRRLASSKADLTEYERNSVRIVEDVCSELEDHAALLRVLKADLDFVFKTIRALKKKVAQKQARQGQAVLATPTRSAVN
ncbi:hypothetical protein WJX72_011606 [[Myrmecia] bisecta]|uniref:KxDL domain-containing protein n=1 Tax=[Myrmecia] bisecta TaxID=41462 RepID=A0AAW1PXX6_9CHLO